MTGGKSSRDKGNRSERELVHILREAGLEAKRVPLSGACEGYKGDVVARVLCKICESVGRPADPCAFCEQITFECKVRKNGFKFLYANIPSEGILAVRSDRNEWLVVERLEDWIKRLA